MKETNNITVFEEMRFWHVISEPGDRTLYDYFVYRDGPDEFCFMPARSTFRFPQRLNYHRCLAIEKHEDNFIDVASEEHCNPHTLAECIRTVKELHDANNH